MMRALAVTEFARRESHLLLLPDPSGGALVNSPWHSCVRPSEDPTLSDGMTKFRICGLLCETSNCNFSTANRWPEIVAVMTASQSPLRGTTNNVRPPRRYHHRGVSPRTDLERTLIHSDLIWKLVQPLTRHPMQEREIHVKNDLPSDPLGPGFVHTS